MVKCKRFFCFKFLGGFEVFIVVTINTVVVHCGVDICSSSIAPSKRGVAIPRDEFEFFGVEVAVEQFFVFFKRLEIRVADTVVLFVSTKTTEESLDSERVV